MKKIIAAAILILLAVGVFAFTRSGGRKFQFLQKGVPVAGADVSFLYLSDPNAPKPHTTTDADGFAGGPENYKDGLISIKATKQDAVIFDAVLQDVPRGTTIIDVIASNPIRITRNRVFLGIFTHSETIDQTDLSSSTKSGSGASAASPSAPVASPETPAASTAH